MIRAKTCLFWMDTLLDPLPDVQGFDGYGRSALGAAFLGSVAYGEIHQDTKIPVLVVKR